MKRRVETLTQERLREVLAYDSDTGIWTWIKRPSPCSRIKPGDVAGSVFMSADIGPYIRIQLDGIIYFAHRLAWFWMTGEWPNPGCDHEDTDGINNRRSNLRRANQKQNGANRGLFKNNTSGWKGVSWVAVSQKWYATIKVDGKSKNLGYYDCGPAAHFAYLVAADNAFGEFARGG